MSVIWEHSFHCKQHNVAPDIKYECICDKAARATKDEINHPQHYTQHPSKVECIDIVEHMNFNLGNAVKYIWRAGLKSPNPGKDLLKAKWYICREIVRLGLANVQEDNPEEQRAAPSPASD